MRDVGQRLLIGLAGAAAVVMAIGYAFIARNIASPVGRDLGTFEVPGPEPSAAAILLGDGRPAYIVSTDSTVVVLDARAPVPAGTSGRLVAWCALDRSGIFLDLLDGTTWDADGALRSAEGRDGLVRYAVRTEADGATVTVSAEGRSAGTAGGDRVPLDRAMNRWTVHRPEPGEVFDPSVAVAEEPPGWIWLEGTLRPRRDAVLLCDGFDATCASGAPIAGIDPALLPDQALAGWFLGRVRDDAIIDLHHVPDPGGAP